MSLSEYLEGFVTTAIKGFARTLEVILPSYAQPLVARLKQSVLARRFLKGALWVAFGSVISRGLGLFASVGVARIMGRDRFGEIGIVVNTVTILTTFAGLGLGLAVTKFVAEFRKSNPQKAGRVLALATTVTLLTSGAISLLLFIAAPWVAQRMLSSANLQGPVRVAAPLLFFTAVNSVQLNALSGFEAFRAIAKINVLCGMLNFPLLLVGAYYFGLLGALWGYVAVAVANCVFTQLAVRRECQAAGIYYSYSGFWGERSVLSSFSLPIFMSGLSGSIVDWVINATVVTQLNGYAQLGLFNAARQWNALILYVPSLLVTLTLPVLSNLLGEGKRRQFRQMLLFNSFLLSASALAVAFPVALCAKPIMSAYGEAFAEGWPILLVNSAYCVLYASNIVVGQAIWSMNLVREGVIFGIGRAAVLLLLWKAFIHHGAMGIAYTYFLTYSLQTAILIPYIWYRSSRLFPSVENGRAAEATT